MTYIVIVSVMIIICTLMYVMLMSLFIRGLKKLRSQTLFSENSSFIEGISIVIPFRNEETRIHILLDSLEKLEIPDIQVEIIYVDDHSTDNTGKVIQTYHHEKLKHLPYHIVKSEGEGKKQAQQTGIRSAQFSFVALTDADCSLPATWLKTIVKHLEPTTVMLCGPVDYDRKDMKWYQHFFCIEHRALVLCGAGAFGLGRPIYCSAANMVVHKSTYLQLMQHVPAHEIASGDDVFLLHTALQQGYRQQLKFCFDRNALVKTTSPSSLKDFIKQRIRWGSKARFYKDIFARSVAIIVFCVHLLLMGLVISAFFSAHLMHLLAIIFSFKIFLETLLFYKGQILFNEKYFFIKIIIYQPVYLLYAIVAGTASALTTHHELKKRWR